MNKAFADEFMFCADAFSLLENTRQFHRGVTSFAQDAYAHLARLIACLRGDIDDDIFLILSTEADKFAMIVRQMSAKDRRAILSNIPDQLIGRIDHLSQEVREAHGARRFAEKITFFEDVALNLAIAFNVTPPEEVQFEIEGEKINTTDWSFFKRELARAGGVR